MQTIRLYSNELLSKYGFEDGDILNDFFYEYFYDLYFAEGDYKHKLLKEVVKQCLLPLIQQEIEVITLEFSCHNPIRVVKVNSKRVDNCIIYDEKLLTPEYVDVSHERIISIFEKLYAGLKAKKRSKK